MLANAVFAHQNEIVADNVRDKTIQMAKDAGLDVKKFSDCLDKQETLDRVNADINEGKALGVYSTPTFFINGRAIIGFHGTGELRQTIEEFLHKQP